MRRRLSILLLASLPALAQDSPQSLARAVIDRWTSGPASAFAAIYPFPAGRAARAARDARLPGLAQVIRATPTSAVLLLSGVPILPNSGDATTFGRAFSGVYEAHPENGSWKLTAPIPLDAMGR